MLSYDGQILTPKSHEKRPLNLYSRKQLFHQHACYKVSVGGWPAAVLVLERLKTDLTSPRAAPETPAARKGKGMKGAGKGQGAEPRECLLIDPGLFLGIMFDYYSGPE